MRHPSEASLALFAGRDLGLWDRFRLALHLRGCGVCCRAVEDFRADRVSVRQAVSVVPEDVDWERLSADIAANIRVGLAAGECVAPARAKQPKSRPWLPALAMAGLVLLAGAWWLNTPAAQQQSLARALRNILRGQPAALIPEPGLVVEATAAGIELKQNGSALAVTRTGAQPVAVTVSLQGAARARYVDDTGQITITSVYAQ